MFRGKRFRQYADPRFPALLRLFLLAKQSGQAAERIVALTASLTAENTLDLVANDSLHIRDEPWTGPWCLESFALRTKTVDVDQEWQCDGDNDQHREHHADDFRSRFHDRPPWNQGAMSRDG